MARKPMSEEAKQNLRDKALARAAAKKAEEQQNDQPATPVEPQKAESQNDEVQEQAAPAPAPEPSKVPEPEMPDVSSQVEQGDEEAAGEPEQAKPKDYADHLTSVQEARDEIAAIQRSHPDMIEAKQAADALNNAVYSMERVRDTLNQS